MSSLFFARENNETPIRNQNTHTHTERERERELSEKSFVLSSKYGIESAERQNCKGKTNKIVCTRSNKRGPKNYTFIFGWKET